MSFIIKILLSVICACVMVVFFCYNILFLLLKGGKDGSFNESKY